MPRHLPLCALLTVGFAGMVASTAHASVLPFGIPTVTLNLPGPFPGAPMGVAYDPNLNLYYGGNGGNTSFPGFVWDAGGNLLQAYSPLNVDMRGINYNPNTNAIEVVTFAAPFGGNPGALMTMGRDGAGLYTGSNTITRQTLSGIDGAQSMPAYDPVRNQFYSRDGISMPNDATVNIASRVDGSLLDTVTLDLAAAGSPLLQSEFIGYDPSADVLIVFARNIQQALVYDMNGTFLGASQVSGFGTTFTAYGVGYTNGQLFVFDEGAGYHGFRILAQDAPTPEPASLAILGLGSLGWILRAGWRRRRSEAGVISSGR